MPSQPESRRLLVKPGFTDQNHPVPGDVQPSTAQELGSRIRLLRMERGLSLAKVAGDDFSRAFLSQVEHGQSTPSMRVLTIIANRLGTRVDELIQGEAEVQQLTLERARVALLRHRPHLALKLLEEISADAPWPLRAEAGICTVVAQAAIGASTGQAYLADQLQREFERRGEAALLARLEAARAGVVEPIDLGRRLKRADAALRDGDLRRALEEFRAARILLESARWEARPAS